MNEDVPLPRPAGDRLFQIKETDLAELERTLPRLFEHAYTGMDSQQRTQWRRVIGIVVRVRWNSGPPSNVTEIPANSPPEST